MTCRILTVEAGGRKVHATMKKGLVADPLPPVLDYAPLSGPQGAGTVGLGFVTRVTAAGLMVTFYNNVYGTIAARTLVQQGAPSPSHARPPRSCRAPKVGGLLVKVPPPPPSRRVWNVRGPVVDRNDRPVTAALTRAFIPCGLWALFPRGVVAAVRACVRACRRGRRERGV